MQTKLLSKITAGASTLALVASIAGMPAATFAAANEFTGTATLSSSAISTTSNVTVGFTPATDLTNGGSIVLTFPGDFTYGALVDADVTVTQTGGTFAAETFNSTTKTITIPVTTAGTGAVSIVVGNTKMTNPATAGQYALQISTKNSSGTVVNTGYAIASVANTTSLTAVVGEALVMTVNNTALNFNVDPSTNNGQDTSQSSSLTVASNAWNGFQIFATLASAGGANKLYDSVSAQGIASSNDAATDNYLKITSTNPTNPITGATTIAAKTFGGAALNSGTNPIFSTPTASTAALTNSTTISLAYDLNVDYTTPAGTYAGTITYTATPAF